MLRPEEHWLSRALREHAALRPHAPALTDGARIEIAVARANSRLPDYARVHRWIRAVEAFSPANGLATPNGRVRRDAVAEHYARAIDEILTRPEPVAS